MKLQSGKGVTNAGLFRHVHNSTHLAINLHFSGRRSQQRFSGILGKPTFSENESD
jgi:hypothetical protein